MAISPAVDTITDGSFEQPALNANSSLPDPGRHGLAVLGHGGRGPRRAATALTNWEVEAQNAPDGMQVGYIQGTGNMSQTMYLDQPAPTNSRLPAAQRAIGQTQDQQIEVLVDNHVLLNSNGQPDIIDPVSIYYRSYQSFSFTESTAGAHTVEFLGRTAGSTALIDQVTLLSNGLNDGNFQDTGIESSAIRARVFRQQLVLAVLANGRRGPQRRRHRLRQSQRLDGTQVAVIKNNGSMSLVRRPDCRRATTSRSWPPNLPMASPVASKSKCGSIARKSVRSPRWAPVINLYATLNFPVAAGTHTIEFIGTNLPKGNDTP